MDPVRVLLVDDHRAFSGALAALLSVDGGIEVVATVPSASAARAAVDTLRPDVAVVDVDLAGESGIELIEEMSQGDNPPEVVVLTCHADAETAVAAARAGALGFVAKDAGRDELVEAIRRVARGEGQFPPRLLGQIVREMSHGADGHTSELDRLGSLTPREREVLRCMMAGSGRQKIAEHLGLSPNTVRTHARNILSKLEVHSSLEAVSLAYRAGLQPPMPLLAKLRNA